MRVTFVLPGYSELPIGGFKAAYQFANGLADNGHSVCVLHPPFRGSARRSRRMGQTSDVAGPHAVAAAEPRAVVPRSLERGSPVGPRFFGARHAPDADCVVATAWQTASQIRRWGSRKGAPFCLVADYEHWAVGGDVVRAQMREAFAGLGLIAYGPAVRDVLTSFRLSPIAEVHVGADADAFELDADISTRPLRIGFPVRDERWKGTWDAIAAVSLLHLQQPDVRICAFGRAPLPHAPEWLEYHVRPTDQGLRVFYNGLAVFMHPSHFEAWPLPPLEAMACGAALLAADSVGIRGFARHDHNAHLVPPGRPDLLADALASLLGDERRRTRLAIQGHVDASRLGWSDAVLQLERALERRSALAEHV